MIFVTLVTGCHNQLTNPAILSGTRNVQLRKHTTSLAAFKSGPGHFYAMIIGERWTLSSKNGDLTWFQSQNGHIMVIFIEIYPPVPSNMAKTLRSQCGLAGKAISNSMDRVDFTIKKYGELTICRWFPWKKHGGYGFSLPCPALPWVPWGSLGSPAALQPDAKRV